MNMLNYKVLYFLSLLEHKRKTLERERKSSSAPARLTYNEDIINEVSLVALSLLTIHR